MNFSRKSIDILFELKLRDSREYYEEQKPIYKNVITEPFAEIAAGLAPTFEKIDSQLVCSPKCVSRVRRDTRFTKDKSLFRDHIWIAVSRPRERLGNALSFYFCIEQTGFSYGVGYYQAPTAVMESLRELIKKDDKSYKAAAKMLKAGCLQAVFKKLDKAAGVVCLLRAVHNSDTCLEIEFVLIKDIFL